MPTLIHNQYLLFMYTLFCFYKKPFKHYCSIFVWTLMHTDWAFCAFYIRKIDDTIRTVLERSRRNYRKNMRNIFRFIMSVSEYYVLYQICLRVFPSFSLPQPRAGALSDCNSTGSVQIKWLGLSHILRLSSIRKVG